MKYKNYTTIFSVFLSLTLTPAISLAGGDDRDLEVIEELDQLLEEEPIVDRKIQPTIKKQPKEESFTSDVYLKDGKRVKKTYSTPVVRESSTDISDSLITEEVNITDKGKTNTYTKPSSDVTQQKAVEKTVVQKVNPIVRKEAKKAVVVNSVKKKTPKKLEKKHNNSKMHMVSFSNAIVDYDDLIDNSHSVVIRIGAKSK